MSMYLQRAHLNTIEYNQLRSRPFAIDQETHSGGGAFSLCRIFRQVELPVLHYDANTILQSFIKSGIRRFHLICQSTRRLSTGCDCKTSLDLTRSVKLRTAKAAGAAKRELVPLHRLCLSSCLLGRTLEGAAPACIAITSSLSPPLRGILSFPSGYK